MVTPNIPQLSQNIRTWLLSHARALCPDQRRAACPQQGPEGLPETPPSMKHPKAGSKAGGAWARCPLLKSAPSCAWGPSPSHPEVPSWIRRRTAHSVPGGAHKGPKKPFFHPFSFQVAQFPDPLELRLCRNAAPGRCSPASPPGVPGVPSATHLRASSATAAGAGSGRRSWR